MDHGRGKSCTINRGFPEATHDYLIVSRVSQTRPCDSLADRMHWLHILFNNRRKPTDDAPNALVFRENDHIVLEITQPIEYGTCIQATFYNISLDDVLSITDHNNNISTSEFQDGSGVVVSVMGDRIHW